MRFIISMLALAVSILMADDAQARMRQIFGQDEWLRYIGAIDARGPGGEPLHLARRLRTENFLFPYTIADEGYVLVASAQPETLDIGQYTPLTPEKTRELQARKLLPDPLPPYEMSAMDWINGHALWLYGLCLAASVAWMRWRRRQAGPAAGA